MAQGVPPGEGDNGASTLLTTIPTEASDGSPKVEDTRMISITKRQARVSVSLVVVLLLAFLSLYGQQGSLHDIRLYVQEAGQSSIFFNTNAVSLSSELTTPSLSVRGGSASSRSLPTNSNVTSYTNDDTEEDSFSACLLVMDDNHRLTEWISYHYYVMNLRYLVIAVDPHSRTSPDSLLQRWNQTDPASSKEKAFPSLMIETWTDTDFAANASLLLIKETDNPQVKKNKHRSRQGQFYHACAQHLQRKGRRWTSFHDTDEFISINTQVVNDKGLALLQQPGSVLKIVKQYAYPNRTRNNTSISYASNVTNEDFWYKHFQQSLCVTIARAHYSAVESPANVIAQDVPSFVNAKQFDTLRYRYCSAKRGVSDGLAKSIIDVSRLQPSHLEGGHNAHRPLRQTCPNAFYAYNRLPLGIHQYVNQFKPKYTNRVLFHRSHVSVHPSTLTATYPVGNLTRFEKMPGKAY